jgi:hypothetical protein
MLINITETLDNRYQVLIIAETGRQLDIEYFDSRAEARAYARLVLKVVK